MSALAIHRFHVFMGLRNLLPARLSAHAGTVACLYLLLLLVVGTHGINMFHYPYFEADEGTYYSQAWTVLHAWRLSPYTYFYDHAPLGWIQMAAWQLVTGDVRGTDALNSGRVFMLLLQIGSTGLVYGIGRRVAGRHWVALLAAGAFVLSTYGIHYHRRILLDNVATFWILVSLFLLVRHGGLRLVWCSALAMGVAVLSKEIALPFVLPVLVLVARQSPRESRGFAVIGWAAIVASVVSVYPLMALLKGEFFPSGSLLGGSSRHVSLLCSLDWQSTRAADGGVFDSTSQFRVALAGWIHQEPLLVLGGTACALLAVTLLRRQIVLCAFGWMILVFWIFIGRGGTVLDFYLVPLLPILALTLALVVQQAVLHIRMRRARRRGSSGITAAAALVALAACVALAALGYSRSSQDLWTADPTQGQTEAVSWIQQHVPANSRMVIDMSMWMDLHVGGGSRPDYRNAHYYWRVGQDPVLRRSAFRDTWRSADYVIATPQLVSDTKLNKFPIVAEALRNSTTVKRFDTGWPIDIRRVNATAPDAPLGAAKQEEAQGCMSNAV